MLKGTKKTAGTLSERPRSKDSFDWGQSQKTTGVAPAKIIPENAVSYAELASKGSQPLILIEDMPQTCLGLARSMIKCGSALDLISIGSTQLGLKELGAAFGILRVVEKKHFNLETRTDGKRLQRELGAVMRFQRDCIEGCIRHQLFPSGEHLLAAGESLQLSLVRTAAAFMQRARSA